MYHLGWDEGGEAWKCCRRLFAWEEDLLRNCCFLLHSIAFQVDIHDHWVWLLDPIKGYLVRDVYLLFTKSDHNVERSTTTNIWLKHVTLKLLPSCGSFFATVSQLRITFFHWASFQKKQPYVLVAAGFRNQLITSSSLVVILVSCGCIFGVGLVSLRLIHTMFMITFTSLLT